MEFECGQRCRSSGHAREIFAATTKANDEELKAVICSCSGAGFIRDELSRGILHFLAACGRTAVVEWFIRVYSPQLNTHCHESGWTALHYSLFFGHLSAARVLLRAGADIYTKDREANTPLDLLTIDRPSFVQYDVGEQLYVWGENTHYTLGLGTSQGRTAPEHLMLSGIVVDVALRKYHSMFLNNEGEVFTCGLGQGGRLGHGDEHNLVKPTKIQKLVAVAIAAADTHALVLTDTHRVVGFGSNDHHQLTVNLPANTLEPRHVKLPGGAREIKGVCVGRFHSVIYTDSDVYGVGLNAGQLGVNKIASHFKEFMLVFSVNQQKTSAVIDNVISSDSALVITFTGGTIHVIHEYTSRRLVNQWAGVCEIAMLGGHLDFNALPGQLNEGGGRELVLLLRMNSGQVYIWRDTYSQELRRVVFGLKRFNVVSMSLGSDSIHFVADNGQVFSTKWRVLKTKGGNRESGTSTVAVPAVKLTRRRVTMAASLSEVMEEPMERFQLTPVPQAHRSTRVFSDRKGRNFAILQCSPIHCLIDVPEMGKSGLVLALTRMYDEALFSDCTLLVGDEVIHAHRIVLATHSQYLRKRFIAGEEELSFDKLHCGDFKRIIEYMYTGCINPKERGASASRLMGLAQRFGMKKLREALDTTRFTPQELDHQATFSLDYSLVAEFSDIKVVCSDDVELPCSRALLASSSEYFASMLMHDHWAEFEQPTVKQNSPSALFSRVLKFMYTNKVTTTDVEEVCEMLVVSDQLFLPKLRESCEVALTSQLTLRNCAEILQLAELVQAPELYASAAQFIVLNLPTLLEANLLEILDTEVLDLLSEKYREIANTEWRRITPFNDSLPSIGYMEQLVAEQAADGNFNVDMAVTPTAKRTRRRRHRTNSGSADDVASPLHISPPTEDAPDDEPFEDIVPRSSRKPKARTVKLEVSFDSQPNGEQMLSLSRPIPKKDPVKTGGGDGPWGKSEPTESSQVTTTPWATSPHGRSPHSPWGASPPLARSFFGNESAASLGQPDKTSPVLAATENKKTRKGKGRISLEFAADGSIVSPKAVVSPRAAWAAPKSPPVVKPSSSFARVQLEQRKAAAPKPKKSLHLIQMEQRAVDELRTFYSRFEREEVITVRLDEESERSDDVVTWSSRI